MKKFLAILVSLLLVLSFTLLVGCKKKEEAPAPATTEQSPAPEQSPATEMSPAPTAEQSPANEMAPEKAAPEKSPEQKSTGGY
ncbi:MAG: hypothetical protein P8013_03135 [Candidatus Sulfobium sp.]|jgi:hypothetical protein